MTSTKNDEDRFLIVILGPTAVGKTSIAINIAKLLHAEIISADSRQFYKEMKIGTSFPLEDELKAVKHHFVGNLSIKDYYNVSRYEFEVLDFLKNYFKDNKYAMLVGGSGLYINAVCFGIDELPDPDDLIRASLKKIHHDEGILGLQKRLMELDPEYYRVVDLHNPNRLIRALEVCLQTGMKFSELRKQKPRRRDFKIIKIGLHREISELYEIINKRVDKMIDNGLISEAEYLYKFRERNALNTVGYKELFGFFEGLYSIETAIEKIKTNTRHYAKRQMTWFRKDKDIKWFNPSEFNEILSTIRLY